MPSKFKFDVWFPVESDNAVVCMVKPIKVDKRFSHLKATRNISVYNSCDGNLTSPFGNADRKLEDGPEIFKGVCTRKTDDFIDVETAREIAKAKAMRQAYKWFAKREQDYIADLADYLTRAIEHVDMIEDKIDYYEDLIDYCANEYYSE